MDGVGDGVGVCIGGWVSGYADCWVAGTFVEHSRFLKSVCVCVNIYVCACVGVLVVFR